MKMIFKVTVEIPDPGSMLILRRTFTFADRAEAEAFTKLLQSQPGGVKMVGTSIDHLMSAKEALVEIDEEVDMAGRVAYAERR